MKSINLKTFTFILVCLLISKFSFSQKKQDAQPPVVLPESYYKGQEEKRKYAESQSSSKTMTLSTSYPETTIKNQATKDPEARAKKLLNTSTIPSGFPIYNSFIMTEKEYETLVYNWFKANPTYRKINK
jgi:hypothetical protein